MSAQAGPDQPSTSPGQTWFAWIPLVTAGFTTLCCLGASAALSLATALGATFLTSDSTLRPLLAATLALTVGSSALTYRYHRRPGPLVLSAIAATSIYTMIFLVGGLSGGRLTLVWTGLALLVTAQVWDSLGIRRRRSEIAS